MKCSSSFIETSNYYFRIIDTPGNPNYFDDLMNGISQADMVILVVDSSADIFGYENFLTNQTKDLPLITFTLNIKPVLVAINKIDDKDNNYIFILNSKLTKLSTSNEQNIKIGSIAIYFKSV